jgi:hypothetical protein
LLDARLLYAFGAGLLYARLLDARPLDVALRLHDALAPFRLPRGSFAHRVQLAAGPIGLLLPRLA